MIEAGFRAADSPLLLQQRHLPHADGPDRVGAHRLPRQLCETVSQVLLTFGGRAFIPAVTAIIVGAGLTGRVRRAPQPPGGHVIVVGLGIVGTIVTGQLHDLGF